MLSVSFYLFMRRSGENRNSQRERVNSSLADIVIVVYSHAMPVQDLLIVNLIGNKKG